MSTQKQGTKAKAVQYGNHREPGVAGPGAAYIMRSIDRFRLRGDGTLKTK